MKNDFTSEEIDQKINEINGEAERMLEEQEMIEMEQRIEFENNYQEQWR